MSDLSYFESRQGLVKCRATDFFDFVTDLRNFEQFISSDTIANWQAEKESCVFNVASIGVVSVRVSEKIIDEVVVYTGDALKKNDFNIKVLISGGNDNRVEVKLILAADLNPILKGVASRPINQFLDILIEEMESFNGWTALKNEN